MASPSNKKPGYHHGDLRRALIEAGLEIVERDGIEALSLRAVARHANVSHSAPYHHFAGKSELLAEIAAEGFKNLVAGIAAQFEAADSDDPIAHLRSVGTGYLMYAVAQPKVFRLMFRPELTQPAEHPRLQQAEAEAFGALWEAILVAQQAGELPSGDPAPMAAFAWSTVHGLSMLHNDNVLGETPLGELAFDQLASAVNEATISGLRSHAWE